MSMYQIAKTILLVTFLILKPNLIDSVFLDCAKSIGKINETFFRLPETTTERVLVNIPISNQIWTFQIQEIDNHKHITPSMKKIFDERFNFYTNDTTLLLMTTQAFDKELLYKLTGEDIQIITITLICEDVNVSQAINLPVRILIQSEDEYPPCFIEAPYYISIPENLPVGSHVYDLGNHVTDKDIPRDTQFTYAVEEFHGDESIDGRKKFGIPDGSTGYVVLIEDLDFEAMVQAGLKFYILQVSVTDSGGLTSNTTLNITVTDADDLGPVFIYPGCNTTGCDVISYKTKTTPYHRGSVSVEPPITATDGDTLNNKVLFSLENQIDGYDLSFRIDPITGELQQIGNVLKSGVLVVKATENSTIQHQAFASVIVELSENSNKTVDSIDTTSPEIILIITCSALIFVVIGLIIGLCIQYRRYFKSTRPIQSLTYLYVRSFKRAKTKRDRKDTKPASDEQNDIPNNETDMSVSVCKNDRAQKQTNQNSTEVLTLANIHTEQSYSENTEPDLDSPNGHENKMVSEADSYSDSSEQFVHHDSSPLDSNYYDSDEENSEISSSSKCVDDTRIILCSTCSGIEAQRINGTDNHIYASIIRDKTDSHCEQIFVENSDSYDEEVFV